MTTDDLKISTLTEMSSKTSLLIRKSIIGFDQYASQDMPIKTLWIHHENYTSKDNINKIAEYVWRGRGGTRGGTLQENGLDLPLHFEVFVLSWSCLDLDLEDQLALSDLHLKTLDTIGNCKKTVFSLCSSQHVQKITNLWKFELNWLSQLWNNDER